MATADLNILALAGGVGGAKLANGLARVLSPGHLRIVVNTGDDFTHLGLAISPDLDTVMYTLAGRNNTELGWGLAGDSWGFMAALERLGGETWFRLGDQDLATHVERTRRRAAGDTLSAITDHLRRRLGIAHAILPMSDDRLSTMVETADGQLAFQDYFVRQRCAPQITGILFDPADPPVTPSPGFAAALADRTVSAVVVCPSNPWLSIAPMLALANVEADLCAHPAPVIAVSPIVGGAAIKGPAAKIMAELGFDATVEGIADYYGNLLDALVIDPVDADHGDALRARGLQVLITPTVMRGPDDQAALGREILAFAATWPNPAAAR